MVGGLGFSWGIMFANYMFLALGKGQIYRPTGNPPFIWANHPPNDACTLNIPAVDCFFRPLSTCGIRQDDTSLQNFEPLINNKTYEGIFPWWANVDICQLGQIAKKPSKWIYGNILMYIMRPIPAILKVISERSQYVLKDLKPRTGYVAVHYRGGAPDESGGSIRRLVSLDSYIDAVRDKITELENSGRPISIVYMASNDNGNIFHSEEFLQSTYGGHYKFKILDMALWNFTEEVEFVIRKEQEMDRTALVTEFLTDISLMTGADAFIGSHSSIYVTAAAIRYAKHFHRSRDLRHTCMMFKDGYVRCEGDGSAEINHIWETYICGGGFKGGDGVQVEPRYVD